MKISYIIGPYRHESVYGIRLNIQEAERLAAVSAQAGIFPYCPHKNTAYFDGLSSDELWLEGNLEMIKRVVPDVGILSHQWKWSSGSIKEVELFSQLNIPLIYEADYLGQPQLEFEEAIWEAANANSIRD